MSTPPCCPSIYANPKEVVRLLGLKSVRALYNHVEKGNIRGAERWGKGGVNEKGNKRKGRLMFVRAELAYVGPRTPMMQQPAAPDPDDPSSWERLL